MTFKIWAMDWKWWWILYVFITNVRQMFFQELNRGQCTEGYFQCTNDTKCIHQNANCNGIEDCPEGTDELDCNDKIIDDFYNHIFEKKLSAWNDDNRHNGCSFSYNGSCYCRDTEILCHYKNYSKAPNDLPQSQPISLLDFTGNNFGVLSSNSLESVSSKVNILNFEHCNITEMKPKTFHNVILLQHLHLDNNKLQTIPADVFPQNNELRTLSIRYNTLANIHPDAFNNLKNLEKLNLEGNKITEITAEIFQPLHNLKILYLQNNEIKFINASSFPMLQIQELSLVKNQIIWLDEGSFSNLSKLQNLFLSNNSIIELKDGTFSGLQELHGLTLNDNAIDNIEVNVFIDIPNLSSLDLKRNKFRSLNKRVLKPLKNLTQIYFDRFELCAAATHIPVCYPKSDGISSHEHLLDNPVLRASVWIMGTIGCTGNLMVLLGRILAPTNNVVHSLYLRNLALSDLLMGVYLFIIAGTDAKYRGVYLMHQATWRHSFMCNLCGFLSTLSCESSVLILSLVTWDRFISVTQPLARKQPSPRTATLTLLVLWMIATIVALAPLSQFTRSYFGDEFYGSNGVCLSLHIHEPYALGWEYSAAMFILLNALALAFICYAYLRMINEIRASGVACRSTRQSQERDKVAQRFGIIVFTDCLCWVPVIIVKLTALYGFSIPDTVYAWLAIFVLPINSALNPVLYTLTTTVFKKQVRKIAQSCIYKRRSDHHQQSASESGFSLSFGVFPIGTNNRRILSYRGTQSSLTTSKNNSWRRSTAV